MLNEAAKSEEERNGSRSREPVRKKTRTSVDSQETTAKKGEQRRDHCRNKERNNYE